MFSIRNQSILLASVCGVASIATTGCSKSCPCFSQNAPIVVKTVAPVAEQPVADEATQLRGWTKSVAFYQSGATEAWPTRQFYSPNPDYTTPINFLVDPLMFFAYGAALPVTLAMEPPFKQPVVYSGDVVVPSYNAVPPLPPEQAVSIHVPNPDPMAREPHPVAPALPPIPEPLPPTYVPPAPPKATKPAKTMATIAPTTNPSK